MFVLQHKWECKDTLYVLQMNLLRTLRTTNGIANVSFSAFPELRGPSQRDYFLDRNVPRLTEHVMAFLCLCVWRRLLTGVLSKPAGVLWRVRIMTVCELRWHMWAVLRCSFSVSVAVMDRLVAVVVDDGLSCVFLRACVFNKKKVERKVTYAALPSLAWAPLGFL